MFAFLLLTSVVAVMKDVGHGTITLATAWNLTSTLVFAVFIGAALKESHLARVAVPARPQLNPSFARVPRSAARPTTRAIPVHRVATGNEAATSEVFNSKGMVTR